jgi:FKBP-type peptidyl-prolyl cis-trans isomerase
MFKFTFCTTVLFISGIFFANISNGQDPKNEKITLKTKNDSIAYVIGYNVAKNLKENITRDSLDFNINILIRAFSDMFMGKENSVLSDAQKDVILKYFDNEMKQKAAKKAAETLGPNKAAGIKWLEENRKKEGVAQTASGLQYKILKPGSGPQPKINDKVTVNYEGKMIDGKIFDSSFETNNPVTFEVSQVIPGWKEGLLLMKEGTLFELYIPSDLSYGDEGAEPDIPGGSVLIFKVDLLKVNSGSNIK